MADNESNRNNTDKIWLQQQGRFDAMTAALHCIAVVGQHWQEPLLHGSGNSQSKLGDREKNCQKRLQATGSLLRHSGLGI